jgi:hypothetical protein
VDQIKLRGQFSAITWRLGDVRFRGHSIDYPATANEKAAREADMHQNRQAASMLPNSLEERMSLKSYWDEWYWRREDTRYVLFRYEEHLDAKTGGPINASEWNKIWATDPAKSIEHVKPQHTEVGYLHNLGNLTMLPPGVNSSLGGRAPNEKADTYVECGLRGTAAIGREIKAGLKWDNAAVAGRCETLEAFIRKHWKI